MKIITTILLGLCLKASAFDPLPCPNLHIIFSGGRNGITFGFQTIPGYPYWVQSSTNLVNWTTITNFTATGYVYSSFLSSDFSPTDKQQYIRVKYICPDN